MSYTLHDATDKNIPMLEPLLTDFSFKDYDGQNKKSKKIIADISKKLSSYDIEKLDQDEKIAYDLIEKHLSLSKEYCDFKYYETLLGKSTGAASCIPVTLSEYPLNSANDVETYLNLIKQIPRYFNDVMRYENKKALNKIPTPFFIINQTSDELSQFIKSLKNDNNCFVTTFDDRIKLIPDISQKEKSKYISLNKYYVNHYVIPSYEKLQQYVSNKSSSNSMLPDSDTSYGLSSFTGGKEYYELVIKEKTGSYRPITELITMTDSALSNALSDVLYVATTDTDAYMYYCDHPVETGFHSPEGILEALSLMIREDYPTLSVAANYKVKTVPGSLAAMTSPAYYMIPAIDDYTDNTIYINPLYTSEENGNLFTTLAHEGFPGHLYQTLYYNSKDPYPIRQILDYPGYVEGWATYVELNSFSFINYQKYADSLAKLYRADAIISLALSTRIDIGVNYENWTLNDTCKYFEDLGFSSYYASDIYSYVIEAPGNYLSYFIGYLEIENLKQEYKNFKMDKYTDKNFHKALLDIGPADFETIHKYINNY